MENQNQDYLLRTKLDKEARRAVEFGNRLHINIIAMRAAVVAAHLESPAAGIQWIMNTLIGPDHLPDIEEAKALGGAQALFDKEMAEHEAFSAAIQFQNPPEDLLPANLTQGE